MGREETMASTRFVPPWACYAAYGTALATIYFTFRAAPYGPLMPLMNGLAAHTLATCVLWVWSYCWSNTSIYDPAWCWFPIALGLGWIAHVSSQQQGPNAMFSASPRGQLALGLIVLWCLRYSWQFPWTGWTTGIHKEDWRYVKIADKTGSNTRLYWLASLISLHLTPTWLVFAALSPMERVWSAGRAEGVPELFSNSADAVGLFVSVTAILIQHSSDMTLYHFRRKAYGTTKNLDYKSSSKKICREGLWKWSRHPNYFGECLFWLGLACLASGGEGGFRATSVSGTWTDLFRAWGGAALMFGFFRVSAHLTDQRMLENRGQKYLKVMSEVSPLVPWFTWLP